MLIEFDGVRPQVAPDAYVAPTASLIGRVEVGTQAGVWFGAVMRGDGAPISLGARSNLQDCAVMHADPGHPAVVGADVSIGHGAIVHGATIGDRVLIGMGATVMNGAVVGDDCLVGAGTLISEGVHIPARSLVIGVPGKVRRELTDEEVARVQQNAQTYVRRRDEYLRGAKVLGDEAHDRT